MEKILNTVSNSKAENFNSNVAHFTLNVNFEKNEEHIDSQLLELNPISTDEIEFLDTKKRKNGVDGVEGELMINHTKDVIFELDNNGTINLTDYNEEKYFVNEMGELILNL
jgi:hypothetical protein